jgi:hypothetical protein
MTNREANKEFRRLYPNLFVKQNGKITDKPRLFLEWNIWTDSLCKSGQITQKQYDNWTGPFNE